MPLKIKDAHMTLLRTLVSPHMTAARRVEYKERGLTETRYLWDCFWAANKLHRVAVSELMHEIYKYMNDDHLTSALRALDKERT